LNEAEAARVIQALLDQIDNSGLPDSVKGVLRARLDGLIQSGNLQNIPAIAAEVQRDLQNYRVIQEVRAAQAAVLDAAYIEEAIEQNNAKMAKWFEPDLLSDKDVQKTMGILSRDPWFNDAMKDAKSPADAGANVGAGILRAWDSNHVTAEEKKQMLEMLERFSRSPHLKPEHQQTLAQLKILIQEGHVSQETFTLAMRGELFNNMNRLQERVRIDGEARAKEFGAVLELMPAPQREAILAAAHAQGIEINGRNFLAVVDALRARLPHDPSLQPLLQPLKEATEAVRGGAVFTSAMKLLMHPGNEQIRGAYFAGDQEARFDILAKLYREMNGRPMPQHVQHVVRLMVDTLQTPEQTRGYLAAAQQSVEDGNLKAVSNYMGKQIAALLDTRAQAGDENAAKDLRNLKSLASHIAAIKEIDPALAARIEVQMRQVGFRGVQQDGRVPYDAMQAVIARELNDYLNAGGHANPQAVAALHNLQEQICNTSGIKPVAPAQPAPDQSPHAPAPSVQVAAVAAAAALAQSGVVAGDNRADSIITFAGATDGQDIAYGTPPPAPLIAGIPRAAATALG
jgi:hypothetical protein